MSFREKLKWSLNALAVAFASPAAAACWAESRLAPGREEVFAFWAQTVAMLPGRPGMFVRRALYHLTLDSCSLDCYLAFGMLFTHRKVVVEPGVYVGLYSIIGSAHLRTGCLIGSRVSLLSGPALHAIDENGRWLPADLTRMTQIEIGSHTWVGEGAIVMANVGAGSLVGTGSVVSARVRPGIVVAGNPARFVRRLRAEGDEVTKHDSH